MAKGKQAIYLNYWQIFVDTMTIFFGFASIIMVVISFWDFPNQLSFSPWIFLLSGCMAGTIGVKKALQKETAQSVVHAIQCVLLFGVALIVWIGTR